MSTNRDEILIAAANGNAAALEFLRAYVRRAHWVDDLADVKLGHPVWKLAEMEGNWMITLLFNPFVRQNSDVLGSLMMLGLNAWADSEKGALLETSVPPRPSEIRKLAERDILKGIWHEVVWFVALRTGGWEKMRAVSSQFREYDFEEVAGEQRGEGEKEPVQADTSHKCFVCHAPLAQWKFTVSPGGIAYPSCEHCFNMWITRPANSDVFAVNPKEANGRPLR